MKALFVASSRGCNGGYVVPSESSSLVESTLRDSGFAKPLLDALCNSVNGNAHIAGCVPTLRRRISPSAVFFAVSKFAVDSVYRHANGALTHIGKKVLEEKPSVAYGNAAPSVQRVVLAVGVEASCLHACPDAVSFAACRIPSARLSMRSVRRRGSLVSKASTRLGKPSPKRVPGNDDNFAAFTSRAPRRPSVFVLSCDGGKPSKLLSSQVNKSHGETRFLNGLYEMIITQKNVFLDVYIGISSVFGK